MSDTDRWGRIEDLFGEAAERPLAERAAFLDAECRTPDGDPDPALREEVETLLAAEPGARDYFSDAGDRLAQVAGRIVDDETPAAPERVGAWRLVREIGRGGMGTVHLAERDDGRFEQTAAVKLVRPGLGPDLVRRFRDERQILARLDHPAIARLLDGGRTDDGRPYLVMEYVDGETITDYCDRRRLGVNERLALFRGVCEAVQFAHRQLVVHRDLKPSNVLVAETDDGPRVKLLDFGIAKLLDDDGAIQTRTEQRVMTPEYAAPEQVRGDAVTTATDVYALGVLLYELLTGQRPFAGAARRAVERAIVETEPTRPSDAVTGEHAPADVRASVSAETAGTEARTGDTGTRRSTTTERLRRRLRGDLDRIVLKSLRKEPERRYDGASALSDDVRRHLSGLPVEARADTAGYRIGKFVKRHRGAVALAAVALVAIVGGAGAALWQAAEARAAQVRAETEATTSDEVTAFMLGLFSSSSVEGGMADTPVRAFLDAGARDAEGLDTEPEVQARMLVTIGKAYSSLGEPHASDSLLTLAVERYRAAGIRNLNYAEALVSLGTTRFHLGRGQDATPLFQEAVAVAEDNAAGNPTEALAVHTLYLARHHFALDDVRTAGPLYRRGLAMLDAIPTISPRLRIRWLGRYGHFLWRQGQSDKALRVQRRVLTLATGDPTLTSQARSIQISDTYGAIANLESDRGNVAAAEIANRRSYEIDIALRGLNHPRNAIIAGNLASVLIDQGKLTEAEPYALQAHRLYQDDLMTAFESHGHRILGELRMAQGRLGEADVLFQRAQDAYAREKGDPSAVSGGISRRRAMLYLQTGREEQAVELLRTTRQTYIETYGRADPSVARVESQLGQALLATRRAAEALPILLHADSVLTTTLVPTASMLRDTRARIAEARRAR